MGGSHGRRDVTRDMTRGVEPTGLVSVVVPSYRRPERLMECLDGIVASNHTPGEVIVVLRGDDRPSRHAVAARGDDTRIVTVERPGVLEAMACGARAAAGDVIVFFDDDAVPRPDWLGLILGHLARPGVGGAGGRDIVSPADDLQRVGTAGRLTWWGGLRGAHHRVAGPPREVEVLKGANMAFRRDALALPVALLGEGAQAHFEVATCLWARNHGWRLVLDPGAEVEHLPGPRFDADRRHTPSRRATFNAAYNLTCAVMTMCPRRAFARLAFGVAIGDRGIPGIGRSLLAALTGDTTTALRVGHSVAGQLVAALHVLRGDRLQMLTFPRR